MDCSYRFTRNYEKPPPSGTLEPSVDTSILSYADQEIPLDSILSGMESFIIACGFDLEGSGIGPVAPPAA
mgnify:CR=1 FL=1